MLNPLKHIASRSLPVAASLSMAVALSAPAPVYAQADSEAPVLIHRQIDEGVAGELQTFLARVSDDIGVEQVVLRYRQSDTGQFESIPMRPLLDSIGEYMIAIETSESAYAGLQYYIEATDAAGNTANRGFSYAPIVLPLTPPAVVAQNPTPGPIVPPPSADASTGSVESSDGGFAVSPILVLAGVGALLAVGLLAGASGGDDGDNEPEVTNPVPTPTDTVTLTIISDQPGQ